MKKNDLYAVILAGGSGTRFWPLSRVGKPKQFLSLRGDHSLFQDAIKRVKGQISPKNILVITNKKHAALIKAQLKGTGVPFSNILFEPQGKNTAPAICWASLYIRKRNKDAAMVVLPSDHLISNQKAFNKTIKKGLALAQKNYLVTFGIKPTRPETGYGYIKSKKKKIEGRGVEEVEKFMEKPNLPTAKKFLKRKQYFWNSGMFMWKIDVILGEFKRHLPQAYKALSQVKNLRSPRTIWAKLPNISVDYAIMEKTKKIAVVPVKNLGWSDLGSWESLLQVLPKDKDGNVLKGDILNIQARNSLVWGSRKPVAVVGINNIVVVDTNDALLVCQANHSQDIRSIVSTLKKKKKKSLL